MSTRCSLAARAEGKVDTKLTHHPPTIAIGMSSIYMYILCEYAIVECVMLYIAGGWTLGANYLQAFVDSKKQFGMAYKVKISDSATLNLGLSSTLNREKRMETAFGYKLQV